MYGWIIGLLLILVLVALVSKGNFLNQRTSSSTEPKSEQSALEILKTRYAKGEISESEFEEKKAELDKT